MNTLIIVALLCAGPLISYGCYRSLTRLFKKRTRAMQAKLDNLDQWMVSLLQLMQQQGKLLTELYAQKESALSVKVDSASGHTGAPRGVTAMYTGNGSTRQEHLSLTAIDILLKREAELLLDPQHWGITKEQSSLPATAGSNALNGLAVQQEPSLQQVSGILQTLQQLQQELTAFRHSH